MYMYVCMYACICMYACTWQHTYMLGRDLDFTRYCHYQYRMVYSIQKGGGGGVVHCAIGVQSYCLFAGNAGGRGQCKDD